MRALHRDVLKTLIVTEENRQFIHCKDTIMKIHKIQKKQYEEPNLDVVIEGKSLKELVKEAVMKEPGTRVPSSQELEPQQRGKRAVQFASAISRACYIYDVDLYAELSVCPSPATTPSTHGLFDFHFSSKIIPIVIPI